MGEVKVTASWDPGTCVWVAESEDVLGLAAEAGTVEQLITKLRALVPELLEANGALAADVTEVPIRLVAERVLQVSRHTT